MMESSRLFAFCLLLEIGPLGSDKKPFIIYFSIYLPYRRILHAAVAIRRLSLQRVHRMLPAVCMGPCDRCIIISWRCTPYHLDILKGLLAAQMSLRNPVE